MLNFVLKLKNFKKYKSYLEKLIRIILYKVLISSGLPKSGRLVLKQQYIERNHIIDRKKLSFYLICMHLMEGWFYKEAAQMFAWIDYIQKRKGITGNLFEIGTHHGKSAIMLGLMVDPAKEQLGICDIFSKQEFNISKSGGGNRDVFIINLKSFFDGINFVHIYEKPSQELSVQECGKCRFFHIDGGHTLEETYNDLCIASDSIVEDGIVVVDDFYNEFLTGVMEGVYKFLTLKKSLAPVAIGFNKLFLCRPQQQSRYLEQIRSKGWEKYITKRGLESAENKLFGYKVQIFGIIK